MDLGTNTFRFFGRSYTGASSLFVSSNGLLTFGSANSAWSNTDLSTGIPQAAIAPLWADWYSFGPSPMVVGQFQDTNSNSFHEF